MDDEPNRCSCRCRLCNGDKDIDAFLCVCVCVFDGANGWLKEKGKKEREKRWITRFFQIFGPRESHTVIEILVLIIETGRGENCEKLIVQPLPSP